MILFYIVLDVGYCWPVEEKVGNFNYRVASNFFLYTYDICSVSGVLISAISLLLLAIVILPFQTIINLLLLKSY